MHGLTPLTYGKLPNKAAIRYFYERQAWLLLPRCTSRLSEVLTLENERRTGAGIGIIERTAEKSFPALKATRARIQAGMELSPMTPKKMKEAYRVAERAGLV
jgi:hypothetical protein